METLAAQGFASPETEPELHLLLERDRSNDWRRWRAAAIVSVAVHIVVLTVLLLLPASESRFYEAPQPTLRFTPLYYTPTELTQTAPNKGKLSKQMTIATIPAQPPLIKALKAPPPLIKVPPAPVPQVAKAEPKPIAVEPVKTEPPRIEPSRLEPPKAELPPQQAEITRPALPLPPPAQQPKLVFENAAPPSPPVVTGQGPKVGGLALPSSSIEAAVHELSTGVAPGGRQSVGDMGADPGNAGRNLPPSPGNLPANIELKSDAKGVDFRPYMIQVLAAVRRNWFAVYPEAARSGLRGEVVIEFAIAKQGLVAKVIYSGQSGSKPLDEAAVAAISASNPLPPLPKEFKGDRIVLSMTFMYNMKR